MPRRPKPPQRRDYGAGSIVKRPTGRYQAQCYADDGRRLTRTFDSRRQADDWLTRQRARRMAGDLEPGDTKLTTGDLLDWWLDTYGPTMPLSTRRSYAWGAEQLAAPLRTVPAARLRVDRVQRLVNELAAAGKGISTLRVLRAVLRQAFLAGIGANLVQRQPTEGLRMPGVTWREPPAWNAEQARTFLELAEHDPLALFWRLLFGSGMRQGELRGLRWEAIDWEHGILHVRTGQSDDGKRLQLTKNRRRRPLRLDERLLNELRDAYEAAGEPTVGHVFVTDHGRALRGDVIRAQFAALVHRADLPRLTPHGVRHTAASVLRDEGADPKDISEILGHSSIKLTLDLYSHTGSDRQAGSLRRMADALRKRGAETAQQQPDSSANADS